MPNLSPETDSQNSTAFQWQGNSEYAVPKGQKIDAQPDQSPLQKVGNFVGNTLNNIDNNPVVKTAIKGAKFFNDSAPWNYDFPTTYPHGDPRESLGLGIEDFMFPPKAGAEGLPNDQSSEQSFIGPGQDANFTKAWDDAQKQNVHPEAFLQQVLAGNPNPKVKGFIKDYLTQYAQQNPNDSGYNAANTVLNYLAYGTPDHTIQKPPVGIADHMTSLVPGANLPPPTLEDARQWASNAAGILPAALGTIGGIAGAAFGAPTGPGAVATTMGGAALGTEAGTLGMNAARRLLGTDTSTDDPKKELSQLPGNMISGAGSQLLGIGLGKLAGYALSPFLKSYEPEIAAIAEKQGVKLPVSAMTENNIVQRGEALAGKGILGNGVNDIVNNAGKQIEKKAGEIVSNLGGSTDPIVAGKSIQEGAQEFRNIWQNTKNDLYKQADALMRATGTANDLEGKSVPIDFTNTKNVLDNILGDKEVAKSILGDNVNVGRLETIRANLEKPITSIKAISKTLDELGQMSSFGNKVVTGDEAALKLVAATMSKDLDSHISSFSPDIGSALDKADTYYADGIKLLNSKVGTTINSLADSPEKILGAILKPGNSSDAGRLMELIGSGENGPQNAQNVRSAFAQKLITEASDANGNLQGSKLLTSLGKYKSILPHVFDNDTTQSLQEIAKLSSAVNKSQSIASGSQTAFNSKLALLFGSIVPAVATGHWEVPIGIAASDAVLSKIFTTDIGRKWLTEGLAASIPQVMKSAGNAALQFGTQEGGQLIKNTFSPHKVQKDNNADQ